MREEPPGAASPSGPTVFISYGNESPEHAEDVRRLADLLIARRFAVRLDVYVPNERTDWGAWMTREMEAADYVVVVASDTYKKYGDGNGPEDGLHHNLQSEARYLRGRYLGGGEAWRQKTLPVILPGQSRLNVPGFLTADTLDCYRVPELTDAGIEELVGVLTGRPRHPAARQPAASRPPAAPAPRAILRTVDPPPVLVPSEFRDRNPFLERLEGLISDPARGVVALVGDSGVGKTAAVTRLYEWALEEPPRLRLDSFHYVSATGYRAVGPGTLVDDLAAAHPDQGRRRWLAEQLHELHLSWLEALEVVLRELGQARVLLVLDHVDELLGDDQNFRDVTMQDLVQDLAGRAKNRVTVLLVGRHPPHPRLLGNLPGSTARLDGGLPPGDMLDFVADLVAAYGPAAPLTGLTDRQWRALHAVTDGHPRALELVFAVLALAPAGGLDDLLAGLAVPREQVVATLVRRVVDELDHADLPAVRALAALGRPVPAEAVDHVLGQGGGPGTASTLERLARARFVRTDGPRFYLPPDPDAEQLLARRLPGDDGDRRDLYLRASRYFASRKERTVLGPDDLHAHFAEIDLLVKAGEHVPALFAMRDLDEGHLDGWGRSDALTRWRRQVEGRLGAPHYEVHNLSRLARATDQQGEFADAAGLLTRALTLNGQTGDPADTVRLLVQLARAVFNDGQVGRAADYYRQIVELAGASGQEEQVAKGHAGLALCLLETGWFPDALREHGLASAAARGFRDRAGRRLNAELLLTRAALRRASQDYKDALDDCLSAERAAHALEDHLLEALCLDSRAAVLLEMGRDDEALEVALGAASRSAHIGNADLSRKSEGTLALAQLRTGRTEEAFAAADAAARFSRSRRSLGAHLVKGVVAFRLDRRGDAEGAFWQVNEQAVNLLGKETRNHQVLDAHGLALCGLSLSPGGGRRERDAVAQYRRAREVTEAPGVVRRSLNLFEDLTARVNPILVAEVRSALIGGTNPGI